MVRGAAGIRHSVGGADYGSVRAAAFMGLALCSRRGGGLPGGGAPPTPPPSTSPGGPAAASAPPGGTAACSSPSAPGPLVSVSNCMLCHCAGLSRRSPSSLGRGSFVNKSIGRVQGRVVRSAMRGWRGIRCAGGGYLCAMTASQFQDAHEQALPDSLTGSDFLAAGHLHLDSATSVLPTTRW